jgi:hypothetical protein
MTPATIRWVRDLPAALGTRPRVPLSPTTPQNDAGMRSDPAPSACRDQPANDRRLAGRASLGQERDAGQHLVFTARRLVRTRRGRERLRGPVLGHEMQHRIERCHRIQRIGYQLHSGQLSGMHLPCHLDQ